MRPDPEVAWPLTETTPGYYPQTGPTTLPPSNLAPIQPSRGLTFDQSPTKAISPGIRVAYLAIILGVAIPLTAIGSGMFGILGLVITWVGIVLVAGLAFGVSPTVLTRRFGG